MEALYTSVRSWGTQEEDGIKLIDWNRVDEYRDPVDPTSLSEKVLVMFPEVPSLINSHVEHIVILNKIIQDSNKALEE